MAHLRNAAGNPVGTTTTEGETRERIRREEHNREKLITMQLNHQQRFDRNNAQQIAVLDYRLGVGVGAKRERLRLSPKEVTAK